MRGWSVLKDDRLSRVLEVHATGSLTVDHFFDHLGKITFEWPGRGEPEDNVLNWLGQQARVTDPAPSLQIANTERNIERVVQDAVTRMLAELFTKCFEVFEFDRRNAPHDVFSFRGRHSEGYRAAKNDSDSGPTLNVMGLFA
jgi:hypothetical protein